MLIERFVKVDGPVTSQRQLDTVKFIAGTAFKSTSSSDTEVEE